MPYLAKRHRVTVADGPTASGLRLRGGASEATIVSPELDRNLYGGGRARLGVCDAGPAGDALRRRLRSGLRHALIDEFQDTDEVQWAIFRELFVLSPEGHGLWVVGDPKQAIYGFRGGDVFTYLSARDELLARLRKGDPSIALAAAGANGVYLNPQTLEPGQEEIIVARLVEILAG